MQPGTCGACEVGVANTAAHLSIQIQVVRQEFVIILKRPGRTGKENLRDYLCERKKVAREELPVREILKTYI